ncbi:MAG: hypothetical protein R3282_06860, partial [Rhodothermales bacterium]|nr:hypothetical protein [Rhodothermales bacterium]
MADEQVNIESEARQRGPTGRSWLRRLLRLLVAIPIAALMLFVCLVMALEVDPILDGVVKWSLKRFVPLESATMTVRRVSGGLLTGLVADDLAITSDDGNEMVRVPRAAINVHLLPLLSSRVSVARIRVRQPRVHMRQLPDSTWDLINAFPADTTDEPSAPVSIELFQMDGGEATLEFAGGGRDSTFQAWSVNIGARDILLGSQLQIKLDSLDALFRPPAAQDTVRTSVRLGYAERRLDLQRLSLVSAVSNVAGQG